MTTGDNVATTAIAISAVAVLGACVATLYMYYKYYQNWTQPHTQQLVMVICSLIPVWGILGLLVNIFPEDRYIIKVFLDLYEGFVIITFMRLIYWYLGGKEQAHWKAEHKEPYKCCNCCCMLTPGGKTMRFLHLCIYQFAISRPLFSLIICILKYTGNWERGSPMYFTVTVMTFSLLFLAMWALFQVYRIFSFILKPYNVGYKFLAIKLYIFLHALQGFVFSFAEDRVNESAADETKQIDLVHVEYTVFAVEMFLGALLNTFIFFHYREYIDQEAEQQDLKRRPSDAAASYSQLESSQMGFENAP